MICGSVLGADGENLALVEADALATLLSDLAQAAGYCPDYFVANVAETVEKAVAVIRELQ